MKTRGNIIGDMKNNYKKAILLFILMVFLIIILLSKFYLVNYANMTQNNFGNMMDRMNSLYLYSGGDLNKMIELKDRLYPNEVNYPKSLYIIQDKYNDIPKFKLSYLEYFVAMIYSEFGIATLNQTPINSNKYVRPYSKLVVQRYLSDIKHRDLSNVICIHFRCSDIPFNRLLDYNIYDCQWYKNAINIALENGKFDKIYIVSCNIHNEPKGCLFNVTDEKMKLNKIQCSKFIDAYANFIRKLTDLPVEIECRSIKEDFYTLHNAGCIICTTGSFAYYAGFTSDNIMIVSETLGRGWKRPGMIVLPGGKIRHSSVKDYYNDKEMSQHMKCNINI